MQPRDYDGFEMDGTTGENMGWRAITAARAQSDVIGVVLLLIITVIGVSGVVAFGSQALTDTRTSSQLQRTENSMTLLDSRVAVAALGESEIQTVGLGSPTTGSYQINPDSGWIKITHINYTQDPGGDNETIYNNTMGSVEYQGDESTVAYQGGGVWRLQDNGSKMVSSPEFHYRQSTLTFPIIRITGEGASSGQTKAVIRSTSRPVQIYPNLTAPQDGDDEIGPPYNDTENPYHNPVANGSVKVEVNSRYYDAWASYFRSRTDANVSTDPDNETVKVTLRTTGIDGPFELPAEGDSIEIQGLGDGHPIDDFTTTLNVDQSAQMHFSYWAESGSEQFELHVFIQKPCNENKDTIELDVYYYNGTGDEYQGWTNSSIEDDTTSAFEIDCSGGENTVFMDFTSSTPMEYSELDPDSGAGNKWHFGSDIDDMNTEDGLRTPVTWDQHESSVPLESETFNDGEETSLNNVTNHFMSLQGPDIELVVKDGPAHSDGIDESESFGNLDYDRTSNRFITFLHVTENEIVVDFD